MRGLNLKGYQQWRRDFRCISRLTSSLILAEEKMNRLRSVTVKKFNEMTNIVIYGRIVVLSLHHAQILDLVLYFILIKNNLIFIKNQLFF